VLRLTVHASRAGSATTSGSAAFAPGHPERIVGDGNDDTPAG
jgi:hypothetical protein